MNVHELIVFDALENANLSAFFPRRDRGVDCLVTDLEGPRRHIRLQVKGSRTYNLGDSWFQIRETQLRAGKADYWIFVWPTSDAGKGKLEASFLMIPPQELLDKLKSYGSKTDTRGRFNVYFVRDRRTNKVFDHRNVKKGSKPGRGREYTEYLVRNRDWSRLKKAL